MPTAVIAEDEPALLHNLSAQLTRIWPDLHLAGFASDGLEAQHLLQSIRPDFAFLDINMPERSGLEVAANHPHPCHIVFVTAYDEYAIEAFEWEAVDYLLKPVSDDRLAVTIERLKRRSQMTLPSGLTDMIRAIASNQEDHLEWIQVMRGDEIHFIPVDEVILFQSSDKLTVCHTAETTHLIKTSLKDLEATLDPARHWRVHRNSIVRVGSIDRIKRDAIHGALIHLRGMRAPVPISQSHMKRFHGM